MSVIGFDFGTTNSLISVVQGERAIPFLDEKGRPIPSCAGYEGTKKILGRDAKERLTGAGLGIHGNIVRSPKRFLGKESIYVGGAERDPIEIIADVVRHVCEEARISNRNLNSIASAVVTIPVDMEGYRRRALRDAFVAAKLRIVQFVHEPFAALYGFFRSESLPVMLERYEGKLVLVFDWGGGTLDLTVCRLMGNMLVQILNDGTEEVGGDVFDEILVEGLLQEVVEGKGLGERVDVYPGARARLLEQCERAKIDLSSRSNATVYVGHYFQSAGEEDFEYVLSRGEMEKLVRPLLEKGFRRIEKILDDADYTSEQVALCLATGGMSNMPAVRETLHALFGPQRVRTPDEAATVIAQGAAWIAEDQAGLQLAKNVELVLARNSYLPLVKAGTQMPKEGEVQRHEEPFHLYCTDPRDGFAKFQICAPNRAGNTVRPNEPRTHLENMTVKVDAHAEVFRERLELDVEIDENLILHAHARSLNERDEDRCEIHNLEFGLCLPTSIQGGGKAQAGGTRGGAKGRTTPGGLSVRANLAGEIDLTKVPGELLFEQNPNYFDRRRDPPKEQELEKLYYQPCSLCGRASNDPACRCASRLPQTRKRPLDRRQRGEGAGP